MNRLESAVQHLFMNLRLEYFPTDGIQVSIQDLRPSGDPGHNLEFDGVFLSEQICVIVEVTSQRKGNREKIRRFVRNGNLFRNSSIPLRDRFRLLGLSSYKASRFEGVNEWRFLYIGISSEIREKKILARQLSEAEGLLGIFNDEDWAYLRILERNIGWIARNELFATLDLTPPHETGRSPTDLVPQCLEFTNKRLGRGMPIADLFVVDLRVVDLLDMCRVLRYQHLPMAFSESGKNTVEPGYQRLFNREKLNSIRNYVGRDPSVSFPSSIVVVSSSCEPEDRNGQRHLRIPKRYSSLDIIDGQHRLFAYAQTSSKIRNNSHLLVTVVCFRNASATRVNRCAATTFVTINKNQAKVKRELIILTSYDALGYDSGIAIAGKILCSMNEKRGGLLYQRLRIRPLSALSQTKRLLPIVTIANEISLLVDKNWITKLTSAKKKNLLFLGGYRNARFPRKTELVSIGTTLIQRFLREIKRAFPEDIENEEDSYLMNPIYLAAFIRRFREMITTETRTWEGIRNRVERIARGARNLTNRNLGFPRFRRGIPELRDGMTKILYYLKKCEDRGR